MICELLFQLFYRIYLAILGAIFVCLGASYVGNICWLCFARAINVAGRITM